MGSSLGIFLKQLSKAEPDDNGGDENDLELEDYNDDRLVIVEGEENPEKRLEQAKAALEQTSFTRQEDVDTFIATYYGIAGNSDKNGGNLLHATVELVKHHKIDPQNFELLVQRLVKKYPDLLVHMNKDGYNPIYMAIREKKHQLVDYMLSVCVQSKNEQLNSLEAMHYLDKALQTPAPGGKTCLHIAFYERINPTTFKTLFEKASYKALAVRDETGKTPMHYAVSFKQCHDTRIKLVDLLIKRDLGAMQKKKKSGDTFLDISDSEGISIYQEHQKPRLSVTNRYEKRLRNQALHPADTTGQTGTSTPNKKAGDAQGAEDRAIARTAPTGNSWSDRAAANKLGHNGGLDEKMDDRDRIREEKKAEEKRKLAEAAERDSRDHFKDTEADSSRSTRYRDIEKDANNPAKQLEPQPNTRLKKTNTSRPEERVEQEKMLEKLPYDPNLKPVLEQEEKAMVLFKRNSDEILLKLKLHYLRSRNSEKAISFLYGKNMDGIHISFDYDRLPREIKWTKFTDHFGPDGTSRIQFDPVLQYVTFPRVEVKLTGPLADIERKNEKAQSGTFTRKDMVHFFEWLYKKGVRHIIRVSVEEYKNSDDKAHSDQAIQKCLEKFIIDHLDWQKTDLDPETILHVSSKAPTTGDGSKDAELLPNRRLRELSLRWSGSNAALRAWSEPGGLPMLPHLQTIYLFKPPLDQMLDSSEWIDKKIDEFQIRLNKTSKEIRAKLPNPEEKEVPTKSTTTYDQINVICRDANAETDGGYKGAFADASKSKASNSGKGVNAHQWLDSTSKFADTMKSFWEKTVQEYGSWMKGQTKLEQSVVVALIDDGIDRIEMEYPSQILEGKSFDYHEGILRPWYSSARGHGTVMAQMILSVCPMAKIYPIRLRTFGAPEGKSQIDRNYAAQAIEAALAKEVDIISMSWTLPIVSTKEVSVTRLEGVLEKAVRENTLMFCSSPDEGKFTKHDYPSGPWPEKFFRIGAARADGTVFNWTNEAGTTFVLPGVDVVKEQMKSDRISKVQYETGSSVATALAAGLAAMIIYCVKASILAVKTANQSKRPVAGVAIVEDAAEKIVKHDAMKQAFSNLGIPTKNGFIQVWEGLDEMTRLLEKSRDASNEDDRQNLTDKFAKFAQKLMSVNQSSQRKLGQL